MGVMTVMRSAWENTKSKNKLYFYIVTKAGETDNIETLIDCYFDDPPYYEIVEFDPNLIKTNQST